MKFQTFSFLFLILFSTSINAQETSVEKSLFGIQTGLLGIWVHNESHLADEFVLRTEAGFDAGIFSGFFYDGTGFLLAPVINVSPRWYYNYKKRAAEGRKTLNNSANFLALEISLHPDWFVISDHDFIDIPTQFTIIPKWAIKRTIGQHFVYELGAGIGYGYVLDDDFGENGEVALDLHLRIGYSF